MQSSFPRPLRVRLLSALVAPLSLVLALVGCGSAPPDEPDFPSTTSPATSSSAPKAPPGHILRADAEAALSQGPAWILRRVVPKEVLRGGAFVGWQIMAMPESWSSTGLKQGDIVTRVNGLSIEKPDDLWKVWVALVAAPELKIAYERDGAAKELVMPIDGAPTLTEASLQAKMTARAGGRAETGPRGTVIIRGNDPMDQGSEFPAPQPQ